MTIRYTFGGDEFIFVEISESMSLDAFFKGTAITRELRRRNVPGVTEICPANASYQVRYDPDVIEPDTLFALLKTIEAEVGEAALNIDTRIVEVPVLYNDPWTHETLMRFRERHQAPESTDLEYAARVNGKRDIDEFIAAHAARRGSCRWSASSPGCRSCIRWSSASGSSRCRNTCARAPTRRSSPSATAAASAASIRCAARAAIRCSA